MKEYGMYQGYNVEGTCEVNVSPSAGIDVTTPAMGASMNGCVMPEVMECPQERCVHRTFCHTVPHIMPINTKIINHHIYKHVFKPCYTCCEENVVVNETPSCGCGNMF